MLLSTKTNNPDWTYESLEYYCCTKMAHDQEMLQARFNHITHMSTTQCVEVCALTSYVTFFFVT